MSSVVLGLREFGHSVDTASIENNQSWYRILRRLTHERYNRYIVGKVTAQAMKLAKQATAYDLIIAGRATAAAYAPLRLLLKKARGARLMAIWYAPLGGRQYRHNWYRQALDYVLGVSEKQAQLLADSAALPSSRVLTIPMGVDTAFFSPTKGRHAAEHFICVGDEKRDDELLRLAAPRLPLPMVRVSPAPIAGHLRHPMIRYETGVSSQRLLSLYQSAAAAFVLTTSMVDIPGLTTTLEAMAVGLPVVVSETVATEEYVRDGKTGYVVPPRNVERVIGAAAMVTDPERGSRFGRAARALVEERFAIEHGIQRLAHLVATLDDGRH